MNAQAPARLLEWDSEHWNIRIARVREGPFTQELAAELDYWTDSHHVQLLSYLCDAADGDSLLQAQLAGFTVVDVRIELSIDIASAPVADRTSELTIRSATSDDVPRLCAIAARVHTGTRFTVDPPLRSRAGALYERWIERDVASNGLALVAVADGEVVGYLTASVDSKAGSISLVGIDESARGRGGGHVLVAAALEWFAAEGCLTATVVTSAAALAAQRLYQRMGFQPSAIGLWLHRWADHA
ncbi:MAG: dTDP-4-amino-4,6-dideoxy-D-galactose acyltransferase [Acidimicrobiaceae bacterium]